jgi:hypothetical protein
MYIPTTDLLLLTTTIPILSSERTSHMDKTVTFKQEEISGREPQAGLNTKADCPSVAMGL